MYIGRYQNCFIINNKNSFKLCGVKKLSKVLIEVIGSKEISQLNLDLPKNISDFKRFYICIQEIKKFSNKSQNNLFIFNLPTTPNYNSILYIFLIVFLSYQKDIGVIYHGYFHTSIRRSLSALLLFISKIKYRYFVTPGFKEKMHILYSFIYKRIYFTYLPVIPDYPKEQINYLIKPEKGFIQKPLTLKNYFLKDNYIYYFGIINPQKDIFKAIKISQVFKLPLLFSKPEDQYFYKKIMQFIDKSKLLYKPIIIESPNLNDAYKLIENSKFVINIPFSGVGEWSSSWLSARLIGKIVLASHDNIFGYDEFTHSFFINKDESFYQNILENSEKFKEIRFILYKLASERRCTFNLETKKNYLKNIFINSIS